MSRAELYAAARPREAQVLRGLPDRLVRSWNGSFAVAVRAPGRANLIGEHTDYNQGFALPAALELATYLVGDREDGVIHLRSLEEPGEAVVDLRTGAGSAVGWGRYVTAVVQALLDASIPLQGVQGLVASDVPVGAGLASSAALEVAIAHAVIAGSLEPLRLAEICQRAENRYVGVQSGIMDQLTSAAARPGCALLIDCRDNRTEDLPLPSGVKILVIHSGVSRALGESRYNERRDQCRRAAEALGVASLRDATLEDLHATKDRMTGVVYRRARHVISENQRVLEAAAALREGRLDRLESLFARSHESLASDYEVSIPEIEDLVAIARETDGVIGARLTGAGFGGCTVNLVHEEMAEDASAEIAERYRARTKREPRWWLSSAAAGARSITSPG